MVTDSDDTEQDNDDGLLISVAMEAEKNFSVQFLNQLLNFDQPSIGKKNTLFYMAGWSARSVSRFITCVDCKEAMFDTEPFDVNIGRLTVLKQRGGLLCPSRSVYRVAFLAYHALQQELTKTDGKPPNDKLLLLRIENKVFAAVCEDRLIFSQLKVHDSGTLIDGHFTKVVKGITSKILRAFLGHIARSWNDKVMGATSNRRNNATRLTIFKGL